MDMKPGRWNKGSRDEIHETHRG